MPKKIYNPEPYATDRPSSVRGAYLYNLVDCLYTCILRRELSRARRAWAILIRCPDVNWRDRWNWGLYLLTTTDVPGAPGTDDHSDTASEANRDPYAQAPTQSGREPGEDAIRFLRNIRLLSKEEDKPAVLAEMVLQLIAVGRYRDALDQLTMYLLDYPYTLSAPLHTYAGMVCFYLAQPASLRGGSVLPTPPPLRRPPSGKRSARRAHDADVEVLSNHSDSSDDTVEADPVSSPNANYIRQAKQWFTKALQLDPTEAVAASFIKLIDKPDDMDVDDGFDHLREMSVASVNASASASASGKTDSDLEMLSPCPTRARLPDAGSYCSGSE